MKKMVINWSRRLRWIRDNTLKGIIPNQSGLYQFFDMNGRLIYIGHSKILRHRIQSYMQQDCYAEHPTKRPLRKRIRTFRFAVMPLNRARLVEKDIKQKTNFNFW
jgi:excinuclease UvrABC nuclease subunit